MIEFVGSVSKGFLAKELNVQFDHDYYFNPKKRYEIDTRCTEFTRSELSDLTIFCTESNLGQYPYFTDRQVLIGGIQPNMILGMLLGADFVPNDLMDADISMAPLKGKSACDLPDPKTLLDHELIRYFDAQFLQVKADGLLEPIPPFFWDSSGRATFHGTLTTAQKFLGEEIFIDLLMEPEKVVPVMDWITECWIVLGRHYSELADLPIRAVHIGECSGCMVDPGMFERYVVPQARRVSDALGPLRFHSCGASTHILELMKTIPRLVALDLGGDTSMTKVREVFGGDFPVDIAPMPADFSKDSPEAILNWADQVIDENDGGNLRIIYHLEPDYNLDNIRELNRLLTTH